MIREALKEIAGKYEGHSGVAIAYMDWLDEQ